MNFGTKKTGAASKDGSVVSIVEDVFKGEVTKSFHQYSIRVKVENSQGETAEYLKFTDKLRELRDSKRIYVDVDDRQTIPAFMIHYPKKDIDGSYFVILNWCELMVKSA